MISPTNINNGWSNWGNNVQTWLAGKCRIYRGFSQRSQLLLFRDFPASHVWLSHYICIHIYIYGWWFQPLRKILASWDYYSQYMEKCSKPPTKYIHIYIYIVSGPFRAYLGWSHWKVPYDKHIWHLRKARRWKGRLAYINIYIYTVYYYYYHHY